MLETNRVLLPLGNGRLIQFIMNIVPLFGVIFWNWSVFALIYTFWLETLADSFFKMIMIAFAGKNHQGFKTYVKAVSYMIGRIAMLLFYLLFMVLFVGVMVSMTQKGTSFIMYLLLIEPTFKFTIISFFLLKLGELIYRYFYLNERAEAEPKQYSVIFDNRTVIIHIVIIVGVFAFEYFNEKLDSHSGVVAFAVVFVLVKMLAETFSKFLASQSNED